MKDRPLEQYCIDGPTMGGL